MDESASRRQPFRTLRARLESLSRRRVQEGDPDGELEPIVYQRDLPRCEPAIKGSGRPLTELVTLEEAVDGVEQRHPQRGAAFVVRTRVDQVQEAPDCSRAFHQALTDADSPLRPRIALLCDPERLAPGDVVFVDIETAGLGHAPLFLIGAMTWEKDGLEVQQFLARNYAEEAAVIALFTERHGARKLLVTFNGKSFDFPFIRTRAAANGIPFAWQPAHLDLLHACRRVWKGALPDCRLQTLESYVCRRPRSGDIPGSLIPEAYHAYVRTEDASQIVEVLKHNLLDLVTLADLMTRFPRE
jgi:uncharacterized protein YprB with RNaseH-like and TPR domain